MPTCSLDECFQRAILYEQKLRKCYIGMAEDFSYEETLHRFFLDLAADEGEHAQALAEALKGEPKSEKLEKQTHEISGKLDKLQAHLHRLLSVHYRDFSEAFRLAHDLEKTEINNIFLMLTSGMLGVEDGDATMRSAMDKHLQKLIDLGNLYKYKDTAAILPRR